MLYDTPAEWHAALNDLPPALLLASVIFDWLGSATRRDSLKAAAFWTLVAGVAGAAFAVTSGLLAEGSIEHGETVHLVMERHETWAIAVSVAFALLAAWRIGRKGVLGPQERPTYLFAATVGALGIIYVAHLGGTVVFQHAGGIPTPALQEALAERTQEHEHAPGEEHAPAMPADSAAAKADTGHAHAPGTPPHQHE
jgi:uncharacterized membrane protein